MVVLNNDYYVEADSLSFTLKRKANGLNKKGEPIKTDTVIGFYGDLTGCIKGAIKDTRLRVVSENNYNLEEALVKFQEINDSFTDVLKKTIKEDI